MTGTDDTWLTCAWQLGGTGEDLLVSWHTVDTVTFVCGCDVTSSWKHQGGTDLDEKDNCNL
jgi:hypothetical protein